MITMLLLAASAATADSIPPHVDVRRDDHRHELVVTIGPFNIPASMPMLDMDMMMMHQDEALVGRHVHDETSRRRGQTCRRGSPGIARIRTRRGRLGPERQSHARRLRHRHRARRLE